MLAQEFKKEIAINYDKSIQISLDSTFNRKNYLDQIVYNSSKDVLCFINLFDKNNRLNRNLPWVKELIDFAVLFADW